MMKFTININFNSKGINLTGKKNHIKHINLNYTPDDNEVKKLAEEDVPKELIESYNLIQGGLNNLEVGEYVKLVEVINKNESKISFEKVAEIKDSVIVIENYKYSFNYDGTEHSKRRLGSTISIPTKDELQEKLNQIKREELYNKILYKIEEEYKLSVISTESLEEILKLLKE